MHPDDARDIDQKARDHNRANGTHAPALGMALIIAPWLIAGVLVAKFFRVF